MSAGFGRRRAGAGSVTGAEAAAARWSSKALSSGYSWAGFQASSVLDPAGAAITGQKVLDSFEHGEPRSPALAIGRWRFDLGSIARGGGRRTIGYKYEETIVPLGAPIYVLGEASDAGGRLAMRKPAAKGGSFIVSVRSEEDLSRSAARAGKGLSIAAAVTGAAGLLLAALDLLGII